MIDGRQIVAALSTRLIEDDDELAEIINIGGHRAPEWLPLADQHISEWARLAGARKLAARGRRGWLRLSAPLGWEQIGRDGPMTFYEKRL